MPNKSPKPLTLAEAEAILEKYRQPADNPLYSVYLEPFAMNEIARAINVLKRHKRRGAREMREDDSDLGDFLDVELINGVNCLMTTTTPAAITVNWNDHSS